MSSDNYSDRETEIVTQCFRLQLNERETAAYLLLSGFVRSAKSVRNKRTHLGFPALRDAELPSAIGDQLFQDAMRQAIRSGQETSSIGIKTDARPPSLASLRYKPESSRSQTGSSAQMCVDA